MTQTRMYWLHALSPTHVGTGRGVGYIDLPIHRDVVTKWPMIPGSAFKGVWADCYRATSEARKTDPALRAAFGIADEKDNDSIAGALIPTDARIVCLPVRSFRGTFAWCTSPLVLQMLHRDLALAGMTNLPSPPPTGLDADVVHHAADTVLTEEGRLYLEDLDFRSQECTVASAWAQQIAQWVFPCDATWKAVFAKRFAVIPEDIFDFLCETGTEVHTRVRIDDETKTVAEGALWNEEALPAETILAGLVVCDRVFTKNGSGITEETLLDRFAMQPLTLQIGGKATVGRGRVRCVFTPVNGGSGHASNE